MGGIRKNATQWRAQGCTVTKLGEVPIWTSREDRPRYGRSGLCLGGRDSGSRNKDYLGSYEGFLDNHRRVARRVGRAGPGLLGAEYREVVFHDA